MVHRPIGIFDSGVGGLTVMAAVRKVLPNESLLYLGDTARVPYGSKSAETILRYTEEALTFLAQKNVKAIVIACNSASAHALPYLRSKFHFPIIGVIEAGVSEALRATQNKKIGVIGTTATISSEVYPKELKRRDGKTEITGIACPLFVPLVEEGWCDHSVTHEIAEHYLAPLKRAAVDTLILGCTHYPLLKRIIGKIVGEKIKLIDSGFAVAQNLKEVLLRQNLLESAPSAVLHQLYVTDLPGRFETMARQFLEEPLPPVKRIGL